MKKICLLIGVFLVCSVLVVAQENGLIIRPAVSEYIDSLQGADLVVVEHTTDGLEMAKAQRYVPELPKVFAAGRFQVIFMKGKTQRAFIFQTEEKVGHIALVIPGKTAVGGYVEILAEPEYMGSGIQHTTWGMEESFDLDQEKLREAELDYFIQMLYKKFNEPMLEEQAAMLNRVKDFALAIYFSDRNGIKDYHRSLLKGLSR